MPKSAMPARGSRHRRLPYCLATPTRRLRWPLLYAGFVGRTILKERQFGGSVTRTLMPEADAGSVIISRIDVYYHNIIVFAAIHYFAEFYSVRYSITV